MRPGWTDLIKKLASDARYYAKNAELFSGERAELWCRGKEDEALQILAFVIGKAPDSLTRDDLLAAAEREVRLLSSIPEGSGPDIGPEILAASLNT